jgi:2,4-dienoyl-CoA reductase (NADPH2)
MSHMLHSLYPLMLSPIKVGAHTLPNRVIMGSLHTRLENEPDGVHRLAEFYAARARGGVGLVVTGGVSPNFEGRDHSY